MLPGQHIVVRSSLRLKLRHRQPGNRMLARIMENDVRGSGRRDLPILGAIPCSSRYLLARLLRVVLRLAATVGRSVGGWLSSGTLMGNIPQRSSYSQSCSFSRCKALLSHFAGISELLIPTRRHLIISRLRMRSNHQQEKRRGHVGRN